MLYGAELSNRAGGGGGDVGDAVEGKVTDP